MKNLTQTQIKELVEQWPRAHVPCALHGRIRSQPEDFKVDECLHFDPSGDGDHLWLYVVKSNLNTQTVVRRIADICTIDRRDIGVSGLKDKMALTGQWISVPRSRIGCCTRLQQFRIGRHGFEITQRAIHHRKLKTGTHRSNRFQIVIRQCEGKTAVFDRRLEEMVRVGVPNYFGPQRFGKNARNLRSAERYFSGQLPRPDRHLKGLLISSARSWLFNRVLSSRIRDQNWNQAVNGDAIQFDGTRSYFIYDGMDRDVTDRIDRQVCHPTGPLWGSDTLPTVRDALCLEQQCVAPETTFVQGLESEKMKHQRRALRLALSTLKWRWRNDNTLALNFTLPKGSYATAVLRELIHC